MCVLTDEPSFSYSWDRAPPAEEADPRGIQAIPDSATGRIDPANSRMFYGPSVGPVRPMVLGSNLLGKGCASFLEMVRRPVRKVTE